MSLPSLASGPRGVFPLWLSRPGEPCPLIVKCDMMHNFLMHLFMPYQSGFCELRCFMSGKRGAVRPVQEFFDITAAAWRDDLAGAALNYEAAGLDCFIGVLPRSKKGRGEDVDIQQGAVFWADLDFKDQTPAQAKEKGAGTADILVKSGGGLHCYWMQKHNYVLGGAQKDKFISTNKRIQAQMGSDHVHNLSRILRLPGTTNFKREEATRVVLCKYPGYEPAGAVAPPEQLALTVE